MQVNKQVLPALVTLSNDADMGVRELSIDALAEVFKLYGSSRAVMEKLTTHLDALMNSNVHEVRPVLSPGCLLSTLFTVSQIFHSWWIGNADNVDEAVEVLRSVYSILSLEVSAGSSSACQICHVMTYIVVRLCDPHIIPRTHS